VRYPEQTADIDRRVVGGATARTFVVRLWGHGEPTGDGPEALRGIVEHVQGGRSAPFRDADALLALLRAWGAPTER
jgi:hypothetical protein